MIEIGVDQNIVGKVGIKIFVITEIEIKKKYIYVDENKNSKKTKWCFVLYGIANNSHKRFSLPGFTRIRMNSVENIRKLLYFCRYLNEWFQVYYHLKCLNQFTQIQIWSVVTTYLCVSKMNQIFNLTKTTLQKL